MLKKIIVFFDKFEDHTRGHLSRFPIIYTFIGGIAIVLFWRGVWHTADMLQARGGFIGFLFYEPVSILIVTVILLATGLFVAGFIGDSIMLSGLKQQKKTTEKTKKEIEEEESELKVLTETVKEMKKEVDEIKEVIDESVKGEDIKY